MTPLSFRPLRRALRCAGALLVLFAAVSAQSGPPKLSQSETEQLARDKLIIGKQDYEQIFVPYLMLGKRPESIRFITSDAMLAAYHALFEDSFRELELRRAVRFKQDLEKLYEASMKKADEGSAVPKYIQLILGPSLLVIGSPDAPKTFSPELRPEIERQAALIRAAANVESPPWLECSQRADRTIDYRRCRPVSFYEGNPTLADYFRAVRWLQIIPLCSEHDDELSVWSLMTRVTSPSWELPEFRRSFGGMTSFVGPISGCGIVTNNPEIQSACHGVGNYLGKKNDHEVLRRVLTQSFSDNPVFLHIMPEHSLPDGELLTECLKYEIYPNGLTVAAFLGSEFAHERMPVVKEAGKWDSWCAQANMLLYSQNGEPRSLYSDYIEMLRALNAPPPKGAPAFMNSQPWQIKTCQTQLAGWAQMRHTYVLQAKQSIVTLSGESPGYPPGFVEPNQTFWREYTRLIEKTIMLLDAEKVFSPSAIVYADELRRLAHTLETYNAHHHDSTRKLLAQVVEQRDYDLLLISESVSAMILDTGGDFFFSGDMNESDEEMREDFQRAISWLRDATGKIERGEIQPKPIRKRTPLLERWRILATLSLQLEMILAKQLNQIDLNDAEKTIIISIGDTLGEAMGYFADAKSSPRDDAPRWVNIAHERQKDISFGAGIGRPRAIYVLYPWKGEELLCTGAVNTYYESWTSAQQLTDGEWKQKLDAKPPPTQPDWLQPILAK